MNTTASMNSRGRDRLSRPINREPHSRFLFRPYEVGKVRGDHGNTQEK